MPLRLKNEKYDITGYVDYVADQYLGISSLHEKIWNFAVSNNPLAKLVCPKFKQKDGNNYHIVYSFLKIPIFVIKKKGNKIRGCLFGFIRVYKHTEK